LNIGRTALRRQSFHDFNQPPLQNESAYLFFPGIPLRFASVRSWPLGRPALSGPLALDARSPLGRSGAVSFLAFPTLGRFDPATRGVVRKLTSCRVPTGGIVPPG